MAKESAIIPRRIVPPAGMAEMPSMKLQQVACISTRLPLELYRYTQNGDKK